MRIAIQASIEDDASSFRLCEPDGTICDCWLPGIENPDPDGALDRGGFRSVCDAKAFALGIDRERAGAGLLPGVTVEQIDRERGKLDRKGHVRQLHSLGSGAVGLLLAADMVPRGRRRSSPVHWAAKLTVAQVRRIRADNTCTQVELAAKYGVTRLTIWNIKARKTWRHVA